MTTGCSYTHRIWVDKSEFKLIYKLMNKLVRKINNAIKLRVKIFDRNSNSNTNVSLNHVSFRKAWKIVKSKDHEIYTIINIHPNYDDETYLALQSVILEVVRSFMYDNEFKSIIDSYRKNKKCLMTANNSCIWPYFNISVRGTTAPTKDNFRIIIKTNDIYRPL